MEQIYLDNSATTKQRDIVTTAMTKAFSNFYGNPSSLHQLGMESEKLIKGTRDNIVETFGQMDNSQGALANQQANLIFTGSGTESINLAIKGTTGRTQKSKNNIITSTIEHAATIESVKQIESTKEWKTIFVPTTSLGVISPTEIKEKLNRETALVTIMHANNEVGTIQPVEEIGLIINEYNKEQGFDNSRKVVFHVDCVQSYKKIPIPMKNIDMASISGHKIHGPKGIGGLIHKNRIRVLPQITGGGQEFSTRSGTENVPGIAGLGAAALEDTGIEKIGELRNLLLAGIKEEIKDIRINSPEEISFKGLAGHCVPHILNISFLGTRGEVILHSLEQDNIYVSTGSACSGNKKGKSHVLKAMGLNEKEVDSAIRFSLGVFNTKKEIEITIESLKKQVARFRRTGSFR